MDIPLTMSPHNSVEIVNCGHYAERIRGNFEIAYVHTCEIIVF
jgi:hypothetical protein